MHRSLHLLFASPAIPKGMCIHAGSPCHGNCLASGFERECQINHRILFRWINHRTWWQFEELCKRESCAGTRSPTECLSSLLYPQYFSEKVKITLNCFYIWKKVLRSSALVTEKWVCAGNRDKNRLSLPVSVPHCDVRNPQTDLNSIIMVAVDWHFSKRYWNHICYMENFNPYQWRDTEDERKRHE